jgi:hypothetical protein
MMVQEASYLYSPAFTRYCCAVSNGCAFRWLATVRFARSGLKMNTGQQDEHKYRTRQGKVRCIRDDIRKNIGFGHDSSPCKSLDNQDADVIWGWVVKFAIARSRNIIGRLWNQVRDKNYFPSSQLAAAEPGGRLTYRTPRRP